MTVSQSVLLFVRPSKLSHFIINQAKKTMMKMKKYVKSIPTPGIAMGIRNATTNATRYALGRDILRQSIAVVSPDFNDSDGICQA